MGWNRLSAPSRDNRCSQLGIDCLAIGGYLATISSLAFLNQWVAPEVANQIRWLLDSVSPICGK